MCKRDRIWLRKEDEKMAVLAVPIDRTFEVSSDKISEFLAYSKKMNSRKITEERLKKMDKGNVQWKIRETK